MLKSAPKISDSTQRHDTQLNFFDINGILAQKYYFADFSSYEGDFFFKSSKFVVDFKKRSLPENVEGFADHCVWTCCGRFFQLWQEYMWSFVNVVKSCPKISDPIKGDDTQLNLFDINGALA